MPLKEKQIWPKCYNQKDQILSVNSSRIELKRDKFQTKEESEKKN